MFENYFKVASRNLATHKLFSFINIFGLALSMSVCLPVLMRLKDQLSFDKFHPFPGSIILSSETAKRYFGNENPLGKFLSQGNIVDFQVTGSIRQKIRKITYQF